MYVQRFELETDPTYLPDQRLQMWDCVGQTDAEGDSVRQTGDAAGDYGPSHGEGQHGVDDEHDEQEERHLGMGKQEDFFSWRGTFVPR